MQRCIPRLVETKYCDNILGVQDHPEVNSLLLERVEVEPGYFGTCHLMNETEGN